MIMDEHTWYQAGRSGGEAPSTHEQEKCPGAYEKWDLGREVKRWEDKTFHALTHPDDPFGTKKDSFA